MPPPVSEFQKNYQAFLDGTEPVTDSMRRGARAFLLLAVALGKVLSAQTVKVRGTADAMTRDHDYMSKLNDVLQYAGPLAPGTGNQYTIFTGKTEEEVKDFRAAFLLAANMGSDPAAYTSLTTQPPWEWHLTVEECGTALKNLQMDVDDLNSVSQEQQLRLNTLMTNLNNNIEASTASMQKAGTQAQAILRALGE
ncbi:hypothetical protein H4CHR_01932 [Variovorax sp. PBS-H4]|uniref:hypothetical protein n=1 Tax=Variovorax sp. PBS-H4 TaxID=434008 RepID=UPI0013172B6B|nr:hypothetical protein [Variovorax sp. PBS-H4]VTU27129.1 hypothetical protein H4CHR_01932 [Variovorax sp. PBS-H4]